MPQVKKPSPKLKLHFSPNKRPLEISFEEWQIGLRKQFSQKQKFTIKNVGDEKVFSDYEVINRNTLRSYKVAVRSKDSGLNLLEEYGTNMSFHRLVQNGYQVITF